MLTCEQIKSARALLSWSQNDLANHSGVSIASIRRIEPKKGIPSAHTSTIARIEKTFVKAGIVFENSDRKVGVSLTTTEAA